MTAANANAAMPRRPVPPSRPAGNPTARPAAHVAPATSAAAVAFDHDDDEFRLNLSDIPRMQESMHVDGLKPTLLSRLFDLIAPLKA